MFNLLDEILRDIVAKNGNNVDATFDFVYTQDARTEFDAKNVKRRNSAQGCAFLEPQHQDLSYSPKPPFGAVFDST